MNLYTGIGIYVLIWWTVIFAVLPWGVRPDEAPVNGQDPGAPARANMPFKLLMTTAISAALWGVVYVVFF